MTSLKFLAGRLGFLPSFIAGTAIPSTLVSPLAVDLHVSLGAVGETVCFLVNVIGCIYLRHHMYACVTWNVFCLP